MRSLSKMSETSYKTYEIKKNVLCTAFNKSLNIDQFNGPRQSYNATYNANGLVDILKTKNLLNGKTYGKKQWHISVKIIILILIILKI